MKRIAILNLTRMGDLIMTGPMINSIRNNNPDAEIHLIVVDKFSQVAEGLGVDKVIEVDFNLLTTLATEARNSETIISSMEYFKTTLRKLNKYYYDDIHNITHTTISAILVSQMNGNVVSGISLDKYGYRSIANNWSRYFFAGNLNRGLNPFHLVDVQLGIGDGIGKGFKTGYTISAEAKSSLESLLSEMGINQSLPCIGIQSGASDKSKQWNPEYFAETANTILKKKDVNFLLFGTENEIDVITRIKGSIDRNVYDFAGKTDIQTLAACLERCDILLSNDTGTMHLADAVGTKSIVITLGNALSDETAPYGEGHYVLEPKIECFPCSFRTVCPHFNCHHEIKPSLVAELTLSVLNGESVTNSNIQNTRVFKTAKDEHGLFKKEEIEKTHSSIDGFIKEVYREILYDDLVSIIASKKGNKAALSTNDYLKFNRLLESIKNIISELVEGEKLTKTLLGIVRREITNQDAVTLSKKIEKQYENIYDRYLTIELLRPILLLLRFDQENIPSGDVFTQIEATLLSFSRARKLASQLGKRIEEVCSDEDKFIEQNKETRKQADIYEAFRRKRFTSDRLTVIVPFSYYFVQSEAIHALQKMGHRVIPLKFKDNPHTLEQLLEASLQADFLLTINHLAFDKNGELENLLNQINLPYVSWFVDRPGFILLDYNVPKGDFGFIYTWERQTCSEINSYGYRRVKYLPLACDTDLFGNHNIHNDSDRLIWVADSNIIPSKKWFSKAEITPVLKGLYNAAVANQLDNRVDPLHNLFDTAKGLGIDLKVLDKRRLLNFTSAVALEATSQTRIKLAKVLGKHGLELYGDEAWKDVETEAAKFGRVSYQEELPILYRKGIHLNSTSFQMPTAVNQRVFDIPMSGGILITDKQSDMNQLFSKDEYFAFSSSEEAVDIVKHIKSDKTEALQTVAKARKRILAEHTYVHRLEKIITEISDKFSVRTMSV